MTSTVIFLERSPSGDGGGDVGDVADLGGQVAGHEVDAVRQVFPGTGDVAHVGLAAELSLGADLAGHAGDFGGERPELVDHGVDGVLELEDLALDVDRDLLGEVAVGDGGRDVGDVAHLGGQVAGHEIDAVGQVFPGAGDALDVGLAAELSLGADLAGHAGDFGGERAELVDHRIDGVLELEDLALDVDGDLLGEVAVGDGLGDVGDVAHLGGQVAGHEVDAVGQVFPGAGDVLDVGLAAELSLGADLAGHARDFRRERAQLVDHRVDGVLELEDLALDVDRDLSRKVALGDGRGDGGDIADLGGQVAGHEVDAVGQVFPGAGNPLDPGLPAELSLGADLTSHAGDFGRERPELVDHGVDRVLELEDLALDVDGDLLGEVAVGDGGRDLGDVADLAGQVAGHRIDAIRQVFPGTGDALDVGLSAELPLGADLAGHAGDLRGERAELIDHLVDGPGRSEEFPLKLTIADLERDRLRQVALRDGPDHAARLARGMDEIADQRIDRIQRILPRPADRRHGGALVDLALLAHHPADPFQLVGHPLVELDHFIERVGDFAGDARPVKRQPNREIALPKCGERRQERFRINALCRWFLESRHEVASGMRRCRVFGVSSKRAQLDEELDLGRTN